MSHHHPSDQPIRLIAADLDGTVLDQAQRLSPRVRAAYKAAADRGVRVTIATGRNVASARKFAEALNVNAPLVCLQGGVLYDLATETLLHEVRLPHDLACELVAFGERQRTWQTVLYHLNTTYITGLKFDERFYLDLLTDHAPRVVPDLCDVLEDTDPDKVLYILDPSEARSGAQALREVVGDRAIVVQSHAMFIEVNHKDAHKGAGLARLAQHLGIPREQVMAIGDQGNDLTMLDWAGLGVAMGNGSDEVKAVADWVAPPIDEDGVAVAIERFVLTPDV